MLLTCIGTFAVGVHGAECGNQPAYDCALSYFRHSDTQSAIEVLRKHLRQEPRDLRSVNLLGIALTAAGDVPAANAEFESAVRADPRFYPALKNLAINEFNAGQAPRAKSHFEEVIVLKPDDELAHLYLGDIAFNAQDCLESTD